MRACERNVGSAGDDLKILEGVWGGELKLIYVIANFHHRCSRDLNNSNESNLIFHLVNQYQNFCMAKHLRMRLSITSIYHHMPLSAYRSLSRPTIDPYLSSILHVLVIHHLNTHTVSSMPFNINISISPLKLNSQKHVFIAICANNSRSSSKSTCSGTSATTRSRTSSGWSV